MRSVNKVIIIGNLTRDPEMRQTPNGQNIVTFGIATNREWVTSTSEKKTSAEFHECVAWAKLAEICEKYLRKGKLVYVEGYLKTRSWDTEEGVRKFKTEIVVEDMIMLNKKEEGEEDYVPTTDEPHTEETPAEKKAVAEVPSVSSDSAYSDEETSKDNPIDKDLGL